MPMKDTVTALLTLDSGPMASAKWQKLNRNFFLEF